MNGKKAQKYLSRRDFLKIGGAAVAFLGVLEAAPEEALKSIERVIEPRPFEFEVSPEDDQILRMQSDLRHALVKPVEERRWVMVIDLRKCIGCHACTIACIVENKLPPGVVYRPVVFPRAALCDMKSGIFQQTGSFSLNEQTA